MAFQEVTEKFLMDKKYFNPLLLVGLEGVIGLCLLLILTLTIGPFHCGTEINYFVNVMNQKSFILL